MEIKTIVRRSPIIKSFNGDKIIVFVKDLDYLQTDFKEAIEVLEKETLSYIDLLKQDYGSSRSTEQIEKLFKREISVIEKAYGEKWDKNRRGS